MIMTKKELEEKGMRIESGKRFPGLGDYKFRYELPSGVFGYCSTEKELTSAWRRFNTQWSAET